MTTPMNGTSTGMNALALAAVQKLGQLPANVRAAMEKAGGKAADELGAGITGGFAVLSIRGKAFRIKHRGEERILMRDDNDGPRASIDVVIVQSASQIAKIFYLEGYAEGSNAPPDCWSVNGITPDPAAPKRQSTTCAGCPQNAWGSAVRQGGVASKGKACADSKRLAVVFDDDLEGERTGGPLLLRVPPASLAAVKQYADALNGINCPTYAVVTRISFDPTTEYPAITFTPLEVLDEDEAAIVMKLRDTPAVERILNTAIEHVETDGTDTTHVGAVPPAGTVPPRQQVQAPPPGAVANSNATPGSLAPAPEAPSPVQASTQRVAEVEKKVTGDPNAAKRMGMKALGMTDEQIDAVLGPAPKAEPEDPRIAGMKALGLTDEQIQKALGVTPQGNPPAPAEGSPRKRRSKEQMAADRAREEAQKATGAAPAQQAQTPPAQPATPPAPSVDKAEASPTGLPPDFEAALAGMLGTTP